MVHPLHSAVKAAVLGRAKNARQPKARTPWQDCRTLSLKQNLAGQSLGG